MAIRPVYLVSNGKVIKSEYEFQWYAGFSVAQKQRSIAALHNAVKSANKEANPLEISTKGTIDLGVNRQTEARTSQERGSYYGERLLRDF